MEEENVNKPTIEAKKGFNPTLIIIVVLIFVVLAGGKLFLGRKNTAPEQTTPQTGEEIISNNDQALEELNLPEGTIINEMTVVGRNYLFEPDEIKVKKGQALVINFLSKESIHDFVIDEYNVKTKQLPDGQGQTVQFLADKAGAFEFYCSIGNHKQMGMKGTLVVEE